MNGSAMLARGRQQRVPWQMELLLLASLSLSLAMPAHAAAAPTPAAIPNKLRVCGDDSGWRPYTYAVETGNGEQQITGFSVEYLRQVLAHSGRSATIELMPWKRCIAQGLAGEYDIVLDVSGNPVRREQFLLPRPHYQVTGAYLYHSARPQPVLHSPADLSAYRVCYQAGYNYDAALTPAQREQANSEAKSLAAAVRMLEQNRCDVLLQNVEILNSYLGNGELPALANGTIRMAPLQLPEPLVSELHAGVSRAVPYAEPLRQLLDQGIAELDRSGLRRQLLARFLPPAAAPAR